MARETADRHNGSGRIIEITGRVKNMILHRNIEGGNIQATLENDDHTEIYDCTFSACNNPSCLCSTLELELTPLPTVFDGNTEPMRMVIDLKNRKTGTSEIRPLTLEETLLSDAFVALLDDCDFSILITEFKKYKNRISETSNIEDIDIRFDDEAVENSNTLMAYNDLLPYGNEIALLMDNHRWVVLDQHCLKPGCDCTDVYLEFNRHHPDKGFDDVYFVLSLNYKNKTWLEYEGMHHAPLTVQQIKEALETLYPDFHAMIRTRHDKLKSLYKQSKTRYGKIQKQNGF